jgi:hypothetical protein
MSKNEPQTVADEDAIRRGNRIRLIDVLNLVLIASIVAYVGYAKLYPFNVIDVTNLTSEGKIPMVNDRVQAGTYAKYDIKTERHTSDTITVIRNIVNGQTIPLSASLSNRPAGPGEFIVEVLLPPNLNPGKYHFRICYEAEFALDRKVTECWETEDFEVFLPEGVDPDDDGLVIPQDDNQLPIRSTPQDPESDTQTRVNLVEPNSENPDNQQATSRGNEEGNDIRDEESPFLCTALGIRIQEPLSLPVNIC